MTGFAYRFGQHRTDESGAGRSSGGGFCRAPRGDQRAGRTEPRFRFEARAEKRKAIVELKTKIVGGKSDGKEPEGTT